MLTLFKKKYSLTDILLFLVPISFVFSRFFLEILILWLSIIFIFNSSYKEKKILFNNKIIKLLLLFWVILVISSILSDYKIFSLNTSFFYFRHILMILTFFWIFSKDEKKINIFFLSFFIIFFIVSLSGIYEYFLKINCKIIKNPNKELDYIFSDKSFLCKDIFFIGNLLRDDRTSGFFGNELIIGSFLSRFLPFILAIFFFKKESLIKNLRLKNFYVFVMVFFVSTAIIFSGERVAFFFLIIFMIYFSFFYISNLKNLSYFLTVLFCIVSLLFFFNPIVKKRLLNQTWLQLNNKFDKDPTDNRTSLIFSKEHTAHAEVAIKIFYDHPFFGSGPKTFRKICSEPKYFIKNGCETHPHNTFLQLLAETGVAGLIIPLIILITIIKEILILVCLKIKNKKIEEIIISKSLFLLTFLISLFPAIPSGNFFNNWLCITFLLPVGLYFNFFKLSVAKQKINDK